MNNNIEKRKPKRNRVRKRNDRQVLATKPVGEKNVVTAEKRLKDGGFIAWPETKIEKKQVSGDIGIIEGRSRKGGFIAFPKFDS